MFALFWSRARPTLWLALPIIAGQVSQMVMGLIDTAMVGRLGVVPIAASAFAGSLISVPLVFGIGLMMALGIRISQARGAGEDDSIAELLRHGMLLALLVGTILGGAVWVLSGFLGHFSQPVAVAIGARPFLLWLGASLPLVTLVFGLKNFCEALENPWPPTLILVAAVPLNIALNWLLIYGNWGAPALGLSGAGAATFSARAVSLGALWLYVSREPRFGALWPRGWRARFRFAPLRVLLELGVPSALQIVLEVGAFSLGAILIGRLGAAPLAAHQIVLACAGTTFMVPLGLSMAASIRVGAVAHHPDKARAIGLNALALALMSAGTSASGYALFRSQIAASFVADPRVASLAATLFLVVAIFQVMDGVQIVSAGLLRGLSDATFPMLASLTSYWLIGLPFGYVAAFRWQWGALGVWIGFAIALTLLASALSWRFWTHSARGAAEIALETVEAPS